MFYNSNTTLVTVQHYRYVDCNHEWRIQIQHLLLFNSRIYCNIKILQIQPLLMFNSGRLLVAYNAELFKYNPC